MIELSNIDKYRGKGKGKVFQFFAVANELFKLINSLEEKFASKFELIKSEWDEKSNNWNYYRFDIKEFLNLIEQGNNFFLLRSIEITPSIDLLKNSDYHDDYYLYNGLIKMRYNFNPADNRIGESYIMLIDNIQNLEKPDKTFSNKEALKIFNFLKKGLKSSLIYKGSFIGKSGKVYEVENVSKGYKEEFTNGTIHSILDKIY
ncbi:hypothetical protein [Maribacter cobaltidurans]|uniref:Uncharacterized protein n=1 Tax=Maribacter cobaltidurans TaxID=1178778 RepID=A0A223V4Z8_9FLAO|nr:hypothetical protein [Maribacter cobaltidurans]ASV30088.1 hypothetical protein CJ263_07540 [Maribacter cobaltidurans]GGD87309.1 hypothetical protein GCM10011412_26360 [Maribacter cobaltidurans]